MMMSDDDWYCRMWRPKKYDSLCILLARSEQCYRTLKGITHGRLCWLGLLTVSNPFRARSARLLQSC